MRLHDKLILVTGASGGIGTILCRQLAVQGTRLVMSCMDPQRLQALQHELGEKHLVVAADISRPQGRVAIADACKAAGGIDALVNLAGMLDFGLFQQQKPELLQKLFEVNTIGPIVLTRELLPQLLAKPQARIVNVGSIFGSIGHPGFAAYCASKAAIKSFSEALSRELADSTIYARAFQHWAVVGHITDAIDTALHQEQSAQHRPNTPVTWRPAASPVAIQV